MTAAPEHPSDAVCAARDCARPPAVGSLLCQTDTRRLGDMIAGIQGEYELLSAAPSMQGREVGTVGGTALTSQRAPGNTHVMALRDGRRGTGRIGADDADVWGVDDTPSVFATLASYGERVREGRELQLPVRHVEPCLFPCMHRACLLGIGHAVPVQLTVATERRLLATHLEWILGQEWCGELFDEIRGLWALLRRANGHAAPTRKVHRLQAPCPSCQVRALTHRPGAATVGCENCGHTQEVPELGVSA